LARSQGSQNIGNQDASASNHGFPVANLRVYRDSRMRYHDLRVTALQVAFNGTIHLVSRQHGKRRC
jgi:hypothetical protein